MPQNPEQLNGIPAEWEHQQALLITWPHDNEAWEADTFLEVENTLKQLIANTAPHQTVIIVCHTAELIGRLAIELGLILGDLRFVHAPNNDIWARDHGPVSCKRQNDILFLDFQFNGWGENRPYQHDNRITQNLDEQCIFQSHVVHQNMVLEGGSIESDGQQTLLTTTACLLDAKRNPDYNRSEVERFLKQHTGTERVLWLENGFVNGLTSSTQINNLARFINETTIAFTACDNPQDEHYLALQKMKAELENFETTNGEKYRLIPLPIPSAIHNSQGDRLAASYTNFLITNTHVFVPQYKDPNDSLIMETMKQHFPQKTVVGVDSLGLIHRHGALHSAAMPLFGHVAM